jgi:glycosyltransferase involved in cell wall biosynthesis
MVHIALLMMVKNEHARLHVSLESVKGHVDSIIIYDTGSTDDTIDIARNFCEKNNIPFRLKEGEFVNFAVSRNVSLEFADSFSDVDYLLLLDTNDELRGGQDMRRFAEEYKDNQSTGFLVCQEWFSGNLDKYYNVRLIKAHSYWRYLGCVHEYCSQMCRKCVSKKPQFNVPSETLFLYCEDCKTDDMIDIENKKCLKCNERPAKFNNQGHKLASFCEECKSEGMVQIFEQHEYQIVKLPAESSFVLFQDRTKDDDKSGKRFHRDKQLLLAEYKKDPTNPRTVFYLAQTFSCLNENEDAFYYYKIRTTLGSFEEEIFHSFLRAGELSQKLSHPWHESFSYYMRAFEHSERVEPLIFITRYYIAIQKWTLAFTFIKLACNLGFPHQCILFVDRLAYDFTRWSLLGLASFYCSQLQDGKIGCLNAINYCTKNELMAHELDQLYKNLKFYTDKEEEIKLQEKAQANFIRERENNIIQQNMVDEIFTKKQFLDAKMAEIHLKEPRLNDKQLHSRSNLLWKKYQLDKKLNQKSK